MKLTREERKAVFNGTLKVLRRLQKPDQESGHEIIVSKTRGGKQIVDRSTGETIDMPSQPRLWITIKGWHLKAGEKEWETAVEVHDLREQNRALSNGLGGLPREAGLKTRWGQKVVHRGGKVETVDKHVPTKAEQHENWTPETERGYGGRNGMERSAEGDLVPATGVDDATLDHYSRLAEEKNIALREEKRRSQRRMQQELKSQREHRRGNMSAARAAKRRAKSAAPRPGGDPSEETVDLATGSDLETPVESPATAA